MNSLVNYNNWNDIFSKATIGMLDDFERAINRSTMPTYPKYDLYETEDNIFHLNIACAGFSKDELDVVLDNRELRISGEKKTKHDISTKFHCRGISEKKWELKFSIGEHLKIDSVDYENGILSCKMVKEIPEELKPKKIEINEKRLLT